MIAQSKNAEIRNEIAKRNLRYYIVADAVGVSESTFCKWLRYELDEAKKRRIMDAINAIK